MAIFFFLCATVFYMTFGLVSAEAQTIHYVSEAHDTRGNAIPGVTVRVYLANTTSLATIYSDDGVTLKPNPFTTLADGSYDFYAPPGTYDINLTCSTCYAGRSYTFDQRLTKNITLGGSGGSGGATGSSTQFTWVSASSMYGDGSNCPADPSTVTLGGGPKTSSFICTDNNGSRLYGSVKMPGNWNGGSIDFTHVYSQTANDTAAVAGDIAAQCRGNGEVVSSTWGTEVHLLDANVTGNSKNDFTKSAAVTPSGGCAAGDMLYFYYDLDALETTTPTISLHHLGFLVSFTKNTSGPLTKYTWIPASLLYGDGTNCPADPSTVTLNSGPKTSSFICTDNDSSRLTGGVKMPENWNGGTVQFIHVYSQTANDTAALSGAVAAQCRGNGEAPSATWSAEVSIIDAAVTGGSRNDFTQSAAVSPTGTCAGGDMLYFYYNLNASGTTTPTATLHHLGFMLLYE